MDGENAGVQAQKLLRVGAAGTAIAFTLSTGAAIFSAPGFVFLRDRLSELGRSGSAAAFFNYGLLLTALFIAVFFAALAKKDGQRRLTLCACVLGMIASLGLAAVGFFPIQAKPWHAAATYAFFAAAALSVLFESASLAVYTRSSALTASIGFAQVVSTLLLAGRQTAFLQAAAIALFGAWLIARAFWHAEADAHKAGA